AQTLESLPQDARAVVAARGLSGLTELPFIGEGIAQAIVEIVKTGRLARLDRLRGAAEPEAQLRMVPGIGAALAKRIHDTLDIDTLEALEQAAWDGSLETLDGIGARRLAAIRAGAASLLGRPTARHAPENDAPSVATLLDVDAEYRRAAAANELPMLAPRRFNPTHKAWLPVLHTDRGEWHFTALYSNTARAHQLGRTRDWVVLYFYDSHHREAQRTVVTETHGPLQGRRVVRGSEADCAAYYGSSEYRVTTLSA
ncbi:MAG TPA: helix-hairpin-helix domain-containing protein, partial [Gammaproteobacteria bacterium]